ncbi:hypothetical protein [Orenia marismortui]|uniref:Uncharacterized protein n=1 Tax=Orenia marismortui TaxID=46469 RepID=A0A4R8H9G5_9FIRM|nr:hypothetical protein [Orenia marismortui]TDX52154.1 hypothetical protein C7959_10876 [Orenia marismortui]
MKLGLAKEICKLQGISFNIKVPVICPFCECKQALIDSNTGKWQCACGKGGNIDELLELSQADWEEKHQFGYYETKNNKGISY